MDQQTYTPGPWEAMQGQGAHHRDVYIRAGEESGKSRPAVAKCCSSRVGSFGTVLANGKLIAASPDLYDACELLVESLILALERIPRSPDEFEDVSLLHAIAIGRTAMAKATN